MGQLIVHRDELFVGRLQLLFRGLELLVDALQLLVGRLRLFARGLQLVIGRVVLHLRGLHVVLRLGQLPLQLRDAPRGGAAHAVGDGRPRSRIGEGHRLACDLLEQDEEAAIVEVLERHHFHVQRAGCALVLDRDRGRAHRLVVLSCLVQGRPQRGEHAGTRHLQHVEGGLARGRLEKRTGRAAELQDLEVVAHEHRGRRETVHRDAVGFALHIEFGTASVAVHLGCEVDRSVRHLGRCDPPVAGRRPGPQVERWRGPGPLDVDLVFLVERFEQLTETADRLRRPQVEEPTRAEGIVEDGKDLLLKGRLEVDQQIAAADQVETREGRVGDHVLPGEHHHVAQRLDHAVAAALFHEEAAQPFW